MMEKEFVTYEQALALKELGFDEKCIATIENNGYIHIKGTRGFPSAAVVIDKVDVPLKQQVLRWFRENGFEYNIMKDHSDLNRGYFYDIWLGVKFIIETDYIFTTYEEAENACIDKLIKIAKQLIQ